VGVKTAAQSKLFCQQVPTRFRATATSLRANAAVLHLVSVTLAFGAATFARLDAGPELRASEFEIRAGETGDDSRRGQAYIGAIIAVANASDHLRHLFFRQAGVGAGIASFRTGIKGGDAFDVYRVIRGRIHGMGLEHFLDVAHLASSDFVASANLNTL
jgi:hypothetical protein